MPGSPRIGVCPRARATCRTRTKGKDEYGIGYAQRNATAGRHSDEGASKLLFPAILTTGLHWRRPNEWTGAVGQLTISFGERFEVPERWILKAFELRLALTQLPNTTAAPAAHYPHLRPAISALKRLRICGVPTTGRGRRSRAVLIMGYRPLCGAGNPGIVTVGSHQLLGSAGLYPPLPSRKAKSAKACATLYPSMCSPLITCPPY